MLECLAPLTALGEVAPSPADLGQYGFGEVSVTADIHFEGGAGVRLAIGGEAPTGEVCYAMVDGSAGVYALSASLLTSLAKPLEDLHTRTPPEFPGAGGIVSVRIEARGRETVELAYARDPRDILSSNRMRLIEPFSYEADAENAAALFESVPKLRLSSYVGHASNSEELAAYGLDDPAVRITAVDGSGRRLDVRLGDATADGAGYYLLVDGSGDAYTSDIANFDYLAGARASLLSDLFACLVNISKVDLVTVTRGNKAHSIEIRREGNETAYFFDGNPRKEKAVKGLYEAVIGLVHDKPLEDEAPSGEPFMRVTFRLNTGRGDFTVDFLPAGGDYCAIRKDGEAHFLIKRTKLERAWESLERAGAPGGG